MTGGTIGTVDVTTQPPIWPEHGSKYGLDNLTLGVAFAGDKGRYFVAGLSANGGILAARSDPQSRPNRTRCRISSSPASKCSAGAQRRRISQWSPAIRMGRPMPEAPGLIPRPSRIRWSPAAPHTASRHNAGAEFDWGYGDGLTLGLW